MTATLREAHKLNADRVSYHNIVLVSLVHVRSVFLVLALVLPSEKKCPALLHYVKFRLVITL